ncbi:MAG: hypothetical protein PHR20_07985 [Bacteroidales bacterium]|nr:hypothetical protein [Bacteroidales bacterium]
MGSLKNFILQKKKVILDVLLSLVSSVLPVAVLQFFILPWLSKRVVNPESYGLIISYISFWGLVPAMLGGSLNNIRLIHSKSNQVGNAEGNYNFILCILGVLTFFSTIIATLYLERSINTFDTILIIIAVCLMLINDYFIVSFRLALNYKKVFLYNSILSAGYFFGYALYLLCGAWQMIYLISYACSLVFLLLQTDLWREPFRKTNLFKNIFNDTLLLTVSNFLNRVLNYADKFFLFPLVGGTAVSIIYTATFFTKILSLLITPINGVVLSYLARIKKRPDRLFSQTITIGTGLAIMGYIISIIISRPLLGLLYPAYVNEAMRYIPITAASSMLAAFNTMINPFVLQYSSIKWQLPINGITAVAYIAFAYFLFKLYGLTGFCIALVLGRVVRLSILLIAYYAKPRNPEKLSRTP